MSTWLGPAFKSTVNNSYQLAQKYIDQTEKNLITDSKFIRNYVIAERLIDRDIIQRFDIISVYNFVNWIKSINARVSITSPPGELRRMLMDQGDLFGGISVDQ